MFLEGAFLAGVSDLRPVGAPAELDVWLLELELCRGRLKGLLPRLSEQEQARCLRYRRGEDRVRYAITRAVLRHILAQRLACPLQDIALVFNAFGKPGLAPHLLDRQALHFNVSHAGKYAVIALSSLGPVGVDIEAITTADQIWPLETGLTDAEQRYCQEAGGADAFFRIWCGKEAVLKGLGVGISQHLSSVSVVPDTEHLYSVALPMGNPSVQAWQLQAPAGFAAALAVLEPVAAVLGHQAEMAAECS
jgi:4'-phosphopantetheinyl transferase